MNHQLHPEVRDTIAVVVINQDLTTEIQEADTNNEATAPTNQEEETDARTNRTTDPAITTRIQNTALKSN